LAVPAALDVSLYTRPLATPSVEEVVVVLPLRVTSCLLCRPCMHPLAAHREKEPVPVVQKKVGDSTVVIPQLSKPRNLYATKPSAAAAAPAPAAKKVKEPVQRITKQCGDSTVIIPVRRAAVKQ